MYLGSLADKIYFMRGFENLDLRWNLNAESSLKINVDYMLKTIYWTLALSFYLIFFFYWNPFLLSVANFKYVITI